MVSSVEAQQQNRSNGCDADQRITPDLGDRVILAGFDANKVALGDAEVGDAIGSLAELELIGTGAAGQGVVVSPSDQAVGAAVADESVGEGVARGVDVAGAGEGDPLQVIRQRETDRALNQVVAFTTGFLDDVAGVGDDVGVIARSAGEGAGCPVTGEGVVESCQWR